MVLWTEPSKCEVNLEEGGAEGERQQILIYLRSPWDRLFTPVLNQ